LCCLQFTNVYQAHKLTSSWKL